MARIAEGDVEILQCAVCKAVTPHFVFAGDTDQVTECLFSAGTPEGPTVVLAELTWPEWDAVLRDDCTAALLRMSSESGISDLHRARFLRTEGGHTPKGVTFAEFRARYRPPDAIYACPRCVGGEAVSISSQTPSQFRDGGGRIVVVGDLVVRFE